MQVIQPMAPADGAAILAGMQPEDSARVLSMVPLRVRLRIAAELSVASAGSIVFKMPVSLSRSLARSLFTPQPFFPHSHSLPPNSLPPALSLAPTPPAPIIPPSLPPSLPPSIASSSLSPSLSPSLPPSLPSSLPSASSTTKRPL